MNIQWYPGHMEKSRRQMEENLKLIDLVIEVLDARLPRSSQNPEISRMAQGKARLFALTKVDLADPVRTGLWEKHYSGGEMSCICLDARDSSFRPRLKKKLLELTAKKRERDLKRGIKNRPLRVMIAGIPNVGKSTLINLLSANKSAKTGNKPGVTRGKQWISLGDGIELLDTPGLLWPKFEDPEAGLNLAFVGSIKDQILDVEELSRKLIERLAADYPGCLEKRYGVSEKSAEELPGQIALKRGLLLPGGAPDMLRTANTLLDEFRSGKLGRITLELPG